ncbi:hypothetical protein ACUY1T_21535 [Billgrantia sp. Q4P2]|uniref:hypothetical protein n=1 Tax=Billgrantia sp. Q4P2 TaxID=3463857 RepID=UPI004056E32D
MSNDGVLEQWLQAALQGSPPALELGEGMRLALRRSADGVMLQLEIGAMGQSPERLLALLERRYTDMADLDNTFVSSNGAGGWVLSWMPAAEDSDGHAAWLEGAERLRAWAASGP